MSAAKGTLKRAIHPALWYRLRYSVRTSRSQPLLSVVIPIYNVERYVAACLDSVISQSYKNLEIVLIDDGSHDNSYKIARGYARWDKRIKIIRKKNAGLGAARNTGLTHITGEYVTFVDSDDTIPMHAYDKMMNTLLGSGSDFIVGTMQRVHGAKKWVPEWAKDTHRTSRIGVKFSDYPDIMLDVFACNKIFKKVFFLEKVGNFPEGIRYEDQQPSLVAYLQANSFDISSAIVYRWHTRSDGSSISQQKGKLEDVTDRLTVMTGIKQMLSNNSVDSNIVNKWLIKALGLDIRPYFDQVPRRGDEYWAVMKKGIAALLNGVDEGFVRSLEIHDRLLIMATQQDIRDDITTITTYLDVYGRDYRTEIVNGRVYAAPVYLDKLQMRVVKDDREVLRNSIYAGSQVYEVVFGKNRVCIKGSVWVDELPNQPTDRLEVSLISPSGVELQAYSTKYGLDISRYRKPPNRFVDHRLSGFEVEFSLDELSGQAEDKWMISFMYSTETVGSFSGSITEHTMSTQAGYRHVSDKIGGYQYTHELAHIPEMGGVKLILRRLSGTQEAAKYLPKKAKNGTTFVEVRGFSLRGGCLRVNGVYRGYYTAEPIFKLDGGATLVGPDSSVVKDGGFSLQFMFPRVLPKQFLTLKMYYTSMDGSSGELWVPVSQKVNDSLPIRRHHPARYNIRISRTPRAAAFHVALTPPFAASELSAFNQQRLEDNYHEAVHRGIVDDNSFFFESYNGARVDDSPLFISHEIQRRHPSAKLYWSIGDPSIEVPDGMIGLVRYSTEWYDRLARSRYLVNNNNFPFFFTKSINQIYVQTWHGTPLKKIGNDVPSGNLSMGYRQLMKKEAGQWDYLLAQNKFSSQKLPKAFGYTGKVVTEGYPRNDSLAKVSNSEVAQIKKSLGIKRDEKTILYAPTWRDTAKAARGGGYEFTSYLDTELLRAKLPGYKILLRGHPNTLKSQFVKGGNVVDVRNHPRINDLFKVADVLITDYSSVMFDFAVTRKPILFLTPDIEEYNSSIRGFYLELQDIAPGPIVKNSQEIVSHLKAMPTRGVQSDNYKKFVKRFCSLDDGNASKRVVDAILEV